jgi:chromosome segregation ATPase
MRHLNILIFIGFRERPTEDEILKQRLEKVTADVQNGIATLKEKNADVQKLKTKLEDLKAKENEKYKKFMAEMTPIQKDTEQYQYKIGNLTQKIKKYNDAKNKIRSKC